MKITVNNVPLELHEGAKVKDAILKYYSQLGKKNPKQTPLVEDGYGNAVAPDGALTVGNALFIKKKRKPRSGFPLLILALFVPGFLSCGDTEKVAVHPEKKEVVIFAVNDIHAAIDKFPRVATILDDLREKYPDLLLVAAGDNQTGNPVNDQFTEKGLPVILLMNAVGFDLSVVGNHEFDSTPEGFRNLVKKAEFDFICANLATDESIDLTIEPYKIVTMPNGLNVAFLGLLYINQNGIPDTHPNNTRGFLFRDPFETALEYIHLKENNDILVALTHLGFENDVHLAKTTPSGIDLIIGGHSHTKVEKEQIHNGILITQAESKLKYGSLIKISVDDDGILEKSMELIEISETTKEKPSIRAIVDQFNDNPDLKELITTASDDFSSSEELGYLMADAQRDTAKAEIGLINPGGVRINYLPKGPLSVMDVYTLDPFGSEVVLTRLTGNEIRALMLTAYTIDGNRPMFPSGMRTKLTLDAKGNLADATLLSEDGDLLEMNRIYTVSMNSYMAEVYRYEHSDPGQSLFIKTADALISYLKKDPILRSYKGEKRVQID